MATLEERVARLETRVEKMDMELKEHFDNQQHFISEALAGVEKRLGARIDALGVRLDARIDDLHAKLDTLLSRVPPRPRTVRRRKRR